MENSAETKTEKFSNIFELLISLARLRERVAAGRALVEHDVKIIGKFSHRKSGEI